MVDVSGGCPATCPSVSGRAQWLREGIGKCGGRWIVFLVAWRSLSVSLGRLGLSMGARDVRGG